MNHVLDRKRLRRRSSAGLQSACLGVLWLAAGPALARDEGADLGASLKVISSRPISAELTLVPRTALHNVAVALPNAIEAAPPACQFGEVSPGRQYRCIVTGTTAVEVNGLAVAVTGERAESAGAAITLVRKLFMIPNPDFDKAKLRAKQDQILQRKGRLSSGPAQTK